MKSPPQLLGIDHVAVAVPRGQLDGMIEVYRSMGCRVVHEESIYGTDQVREVMLRVGDSDNMIQLLEPLTDESPVAKQIEKNGGRAALAHVAFRVESAQATFDAFRESDINTVESEPRLGGSGSSVFFIHPKTHPSASLGVLYEVVQPAEEGHGE